MVLLGSGVLANLAFSADAARSQATVEQTAPRPPEPVAAPMCGRRLEPVRARDEKSVWALHLMLGPRELAQLRRAGVRIQEKRDKCMSQSLSYLEPSSTTNHPWRCPRSGHLS